MTMETYINKMSKPFPNVNERRCPIGTERLSEKSDPQNPFPASEYAHIVGQLLWVSLTVRYDIAFSVKELSKFLQQPSLAHYRAAMRVVGYLKKTSKLGILFAREPTFPEQPTGVDISKFQGNRYGYSLFDSPIEHGKVQDNLIHLAGFADADFAGDIDKRLSTSDFIVYCCGAPVTWSSKAQTCVASSTFESELIALHALIREILVIAQVLNDMGFHKTAPLSIYYDNTV